MDKLSLRLGIDVDKEEQNLIMAIGLCAGASIGFLFALVLKRKLGL